jgi:hypothetical protein
MFLVSTDQSDWGWWKIGDVDSLTLSLVQSYTTKVYQAAQGMAVFIARRGEVFFNLTEQRLIPYIYSLSKDSIIGNYLEVLGPTGNFQILRPNEKVT